MLKISKQEFNEQVKEVKDLITIAEQVERLGKLYIITEEKRENSIILRGSINAGWYYEEVEKIIDIKKIHDEYYSKDYSSKKEKMILSYCEGDLIIEIFDNENSFNTGVEKTIKWYEEN